MVPPIFPKVPYSHYLKQTHRSAGAVVEVFDISCFSGSSLFNTIQNDAFNIWNNVSSNVTTQDVIKAFGDAPVVLGQHYFIANGSSISPVWDFTSDAEKGNAEAFVVAAVVGDIPAPTGADDVDWLQLKKVEGELADTVYRVETKGGQPPASVSTVELYALWVLAASLTLFLFAVHRWGSATVGQVHHTIL